MSAALRMDAEKTEQRPGWSLRKISGNLPLNRRRAWFLLSLVSLGMAGCDSLGPGLTTPLSPEVKPSFEVSWGLDYCPSCRRRRPEGELELLAFQTALYDHIDANCVDQSLGAGAFAWLDTQLSLGKVGVDLDVMERPEWNYARGYWIHESLRYSYDGIAIYAAVQVVQGDSRDLAATLVHETAHEFGMTQDDEALAEGIAMMCTY